MALSFRSKLEPQPTQADHSDRYEHLIEATRLAGREQEAFDLYGYVWGGYRNLGPVFGEYERGYRSATRPARKRPS